MENRKVGYLLIGVSILIVLIILLFNSALKEIVNSSCTMAGHENCIMYQTISKQTYLSFGITFLLVVVASLLIFTKPQEKVVLKKIQVKQPPVKLDTSNLTSEEKQTLNLIQENKTIFQADLIEKLNFSKAKVSRILDRLENRGFVERKRRGMTNVVVLK